MTQELMVAAEVAKLLGVSKAWVYRAAREGRIPSVRLGGPDGPVRFVRSDIEAWLERARAGWRPGDSSGDTLRRAS